MLQSNLPFNNETVVVTNVLETGTAFGVTHDDEQVFLPPSLYRAVGFQPGDVLNARVIPNRLHAEDPTKAKWMAIRVELVDTFDQPSVPIPASMIPDLAAEPETDPDDPANWTSEQLKEEVLLMLGDTKGFWSSKDVTLEIFGDGYTTEENGRAKTALRALHREGKVAKVSFHTREEQAKASRELYTTHPRPWVDFLRGGDGADV